MKRRSFIQSLMAIPVVAAVARFVPATPAPALSVRRFPQCAVCCETIWAGEEIYTHQYTSSHLRHFRKDFSSGQGQSVQI